MQSDSPRVLVIENDDVLRVMLFTVLQHQALGVDTATDAAHALEKTRQCDYAMIIIDLHDPQTDAAHFLETFREERPGATTCILGVRHPDDDAVFDPSLLSATMTKPLEIDTLAEVVRECAHVVPAPDDPLPCPSAENDARARLSRSLAPN